MATWDDVQAVALSLPEASEGESWGSRAWKVRGKLFVWERPLRDREVQELGTAEPDGPILGARVEDLEAKEALLASDPDVFFTTSHFDGYAAVLVRLDRVPADVLRELIVEAWLLRAPKRVAREYAEANLGEG